ncbi:hypothetical protein [Amycolatopsis sp. WAC 04182]|uniref:hypothetical protein n=1 Tax=Amycolatopsis sp. WAC 04182 TaxID=2203198 RepID=UPI0018F6B83E|nr:hypothetical protein [Amycolatopsis sp. WAC 04182]
MVEELLGQDIGGVPIRAGKFVLAPLRAGNHDRGRFPEPDLVDLSRAPGHLTLARTELQVGITALLTAAPRLRLAVPFEELAWRPMFLTLRGPATVPLTW